MQESNKNNEFTKLIYVKTYCITWIINLIMDLQPFYDMKEFRTRQNKVLWTHIYKTTFNQCVSRSIHIWFSNSLHIAILMIRMIADIYTQYIVTNKFILNVESSVYCSKLNYLVVVLEPKKIQPICFLLHLYQF